ncbi:GNAT family N-acetyltransferase [Lactococcus carnosus]|uniref:GNAT family N-acetyltransferase n=1 Tax=Pseudolactococcus carnosus TaxID=2749961 RepID=A0ABT0ASW2_9LACT|nr:GNAT family N-acetyltransferase [Lactococcus carnosus]MCJ1989660.1 GNAT family N-acetyltransferase [Lactococcus carnosus]MCJ2002581.1 GNAT family N-acetyltransferase [Lactococcus carnosus]
MLTLTKMHQANFDDYMATAITTYASEKEANGSWPKADALSNAETAYQQLLPDGLLTADNYLYIIQEKAETLGYIWFAKSNQDSETAFIYDFEIYPAFQNRGFGTQALSLVESEAKQLGFSALSLHVFGSNAPAIHLYKKVGFGVTDISMRKTL